MRHVSKALQIFSQSNDLAPFITILNEDDVKGVAPVVSFSIQSDPVG